MKKYLSFVGLVVLLTGAGCNIETTGNNVSTKSVDSPIEMATSTGMANTNPDLLKKWTGDWQYMRSEDGYEDSLSFSLKENNQKITGNFMGVWSFPTAPAARLNDGFIEVTSVNENTLHVKWEGSRDDTGTAVLTLSKDKKTITWVGKLDEGVFDDGYHLAGTFTFKKN